jgi:hypothetical protein
MIFILRFVRVISGPEVGIIFKNGKYGVIHSGATLPGLFFGSKLCLPPVLNVSLQFDIVFIDRATFIRYAAFERVLKSVDVNNFRLLRNNKLRRHHNFEHLLRFLPEEAHHEPPTLPVA